MIAAALTFTGLMAGPLERASAADLPSAPALLSTALQTTGPQQVDELEGRKEDAPAAEQAAPVVSPLDTVAEPTAPAEAVPPPAPVEAAPPVESTPQTIAADAEPVQAPAAVAAQPAQAAANPSPAPTRPSHGVGKYTVARGDTMFSIAKRVELSLGVLSAVNNISDPGAVKAGQTLYIPAEPGSVHLAARGDTVRSVAEKYQLKADAIGKANRLDKDAKLDAGHPVLIPGVIPAGATAMKPFTDAPRAVSSTAPQTVSAAGGISPLPVSKSAQTTAPATMARAPRAAAGDTLIWPVSGPLSTNFSPSHRGLDVVANQGVPVRAALAGRVVGAGEDGGPYGWYVMVEHGGGFTTVYAHLSKIRARVGEVLDRGQVLGEVGSTGQSTGAHLHFELRQANLPIDPRPYLP
jgi:lipoprotein NlpD